MKEFSIKNFKICIDDKLYNEAIKVGIIEGNFDHYEQLTFENYIRAGLCKTFEEVSNFSFEKARCACSDEEISKIVEKTMTEDILIHGGKLLITAQTNLENEIVSFLKTTEFFKEKVQSVFVCKETPNVFWYKPKSSYTKRDEIALFSEIENRGLDIVVDDITFASPALSFKEI